MTTPLLTPQQLEKVRKNPIPYHVAIIPDGNRRWAKKHLFQTIIGHRKGCEVLMDVVQAADEIGIKALTFYTFSTENWQRPKVEVDMLMRLLEDYLVDQRPRMLQNGIRLHSIGNIAGLPPKIQDLLKETQEITSKGTAIDLILALNYGARDEICRAVTRILDDYSNQRVQKEDLTESLISRYLDTTKWKDPDLLIRTSGEHRISNFLLWQISYSELYMPEVLWPDFKPHHLLEAILNFQQRQRRLGE